ncbi:DUF1524 domain-containing protein [Streptomyces cinnamoneus]|uniref:GmrSD restriction endonuclease domain-containing protein n=1 Tax=Streptomyces cinnamoneus TaxID=53446 RepID=UPI0034419AAA
MRPEEIFMPWYRRLTLPSVITMGLVFSGTALPGTAADAAPRTGQAPAYQRGGASPMDYEEAACEGPTADEGDVYSQPPRTSTAKTLPENTTHKPQEGTHPKGPEGAHPKPQEGTHPKAQEGTHPKTAEGTHAKTPEAAPSTAPKDAPAKAQEGTHPKTAEGTHAKTPDGTHPKAPEAAPSAAAKDASAKEAPATMPPQHRAAALPMKWPRNIPDRDDAARMLDELDVQPFSSKGYDRRHFGGACWVRHGLNRCTTRELVLKLQSVVPATLDGLCRVVGGKWRSEYDNRDMADPTHMDVDHIVPLRNAWGSGASSWTPRKRQEFANDMTATPQLIAVSTWSNRRKGDKGPDKWLPQGGECTYSRAWIAVKDYYGLSVTLAEKAKLQEVIAGCRT